jgi:hypothetical protein
VSEGARRQVTCRAAAAASRELELGSEIAVDAQTSSCLDPAKARAHPAPARAGYWVSALRRGV